MRQWRWIGICVLRGLTGVCRVWRGRGWGPGRLRWADRDFLHQDSLMKRGCSCSPQLILIDKPRLETQMVRSSQKGCGKYQASVTLAEGGHVSPSLAVSSQCCQDSGRCNRVCRLQGSTLPRALRKAIQSSPSHSWYCTESRWRGIWRTCHCSALRETSMELTT